MNGPPSYTLVPLLLLSLFWGAAHADPGRLTRAKARFEAGETHYRLGKFSEALAEYEAALKLARRPSIVFNIAQCHRQLGQPKKALFFYRLYLSDWERSKPGKPVPYHDEVKGHISRLSRRVNTTRPRPSPAKTPTHGLLTLRGVPRGAQVFVDGVLRGRGPLSGAIELQPGTHRLELTHPKFSPWEGTVRLSAGERRAEAVTMAAQKQRSKLWLGLGIASAGLAVGAEVMGIVFMVKGNDLYKDDPKVDDYATYSYVGHGLAGAFVAASAVSFVMYYLSGRPNKNTAGVTLLPTAGGALLSGRF